MSEDILVVTDKPFILINNKIAISLFIYPPIIKINKILIIYIFI